MREMPNAPPACIPEGPGSHTTMGAGSCTRGRFTGSRMFLADEIEVLRHEVELLGLAPYFREHVYGALDECRKFSKQMIIERIRRDKDLHGEELLGFGDGFVEIEEVRGAGGVAVAVASDEVNRRGVNAWKRDRLVRAGADLVIPEYRRHPRLLRYLLAED